MCRSLAQAGSLALVLGQEDLALLLVAVEVQIPEVEAVHQVVRGQAGLRGNLWLVRRYRADEKHKRNGPLCQV